MKKRYHKILNKKRRRLEKRLARRHYTDQTQSMFKHAHIDYEMAERTQATGYGGVGAMHALVGALGLDKDINAGLHLLKWHLPYFESDHVLNIAYNVVSGGTCLEDIERLRQDESYTDMLDAERIPDPTTAGDFLRRFDAMALLKLQEIFHGARQKIWARQPASFRQAAILDVDGTVAGTRGECKAGMDIAYNGVWGYAPLILSLANTKEVLYLVNRPGNHTSSQGAAPWMDRAIALVTRVFGKVWLRGDTDFSLTQNLDRWDEQVGFVFGYDAHANLIEQAQTLPKAAWQRLERPPPYEVKTKPRRRPENVKEKIVKKRGYKNLRLLREEVAEFDYRPTACQKTYRMVVLRKHLRIEKGDKVLGEEVRYFFYITNDRTKSAAEIVEFANGRGDQENVIGQLKSGINALRMPAGGLLANGAYMVIAALAWNLKAWYGLLVPDAAAGQAIVHMEFKRFLLNFIQLPCQVVRSGRRLIYRILTYNQHLKTFFATFELLKQGAFP